MEREKVYCAFCHVFIHPDDGIVEVDGRKYHRGHTPDKTKMRLPNDPKLNAHVGKVYLKEAT